MEELAIDQNYFLADYNSVVDLMNIGTAARQSVCKIDAESPFLCNFVSQEMLGRLSPETPMQLVQKASIPITPENRYIVMRSANGVPTKVNIKIEPFMAAEYVNTEAYTPKSTIKKSPASKDATLRQIMFWVFMGLTVFAILGVYYLFQKQAAKKGIVACKSPWSCAVDNYKETGKFTKAAVEGAKQMGQNIKQFASTSYF